MSSPYTPEFYKKKFEAIPDENWIVGDLDGYEEGQHCALGHCGVTEEVTDEDIEAGLDYHYTRSGKTLNDMFEKYLGVCVPGINDATASDPVLKKIGINSKELDTPKARILKALDIIAEKKKLEPVKPKKVKEVKKVEVEQDEESLEVET